MPLICKFTVRMSNGSGPINPIGYKRTTRYAARFNKAYQRYVEWKKQVEIAYWEMNGAKGLPIRHPIKSHDKHYVKLAIYYKDFTHGDSDNVFKGILDALFQTDKYVAGSYDFGYDKADPRCEVEITKGD